MTGRDELRLAGGRERVYWPIRKRGGDTRRQEIGVLDDPRREEVGLNVRAWMLVHAGPPC
jgi:hypothetical protein